MSRNNWGGPPLDTEKFASSYEGSEGEELVVNVNIAEATGSWLSSICMLFFTVKRFPVY